MSRNFNDSRSESAMNRNVDMLRGRTNRYLQWNLSVFPIEKNRNILDLGCGLGMYFDQIMRYSPHMYVAGDYSPNYVEEMKKLCQGRANCEVFQIDLMDHQIAEYLKGYQFDYILFLDVLEHIEDERLALKNIHTLMEACRVNSLFLRVPALPSIYGVNDEAIGHYRRYSAKSLKKLLESCSFHVDLIRYQNFISIAPWYIIGKILRRTLAVSKTEGSIFNFIAPALKWIESIISPPKGLSLYCVCSVKK